MCFASYSHYFSSLRLPRSDLWTPTASYSASFQPTPTPAISRPPDIRSIVAKLFAVATGFSLIWQIWWLVILGLIGAYVTFVVFAWRDIHEIEIPAEEVARIDRANRAARAAALHGQPAR